MDAKARRALEVFRRCVDTGRYLVLPHFVERMHERSYFWPDVLAVVDSPSEVWFDGRDDFDRPRWIIAGTADYDLPVELVCVMDTDDRGNTTVFITIY